MEKMARLIGKLWLGGILLTYGLAILIFILTFIVKGLLPIFI